MANHIPLLCDLFLPLDLQVLFVFAIESTRKRGLGEGALSMYALLGVSLSHTQVSIGKE